MMTGKAVRCGCGARIYVTYDHPGMGERPDSVQLAVGVAHNPPTNDERCRLYVEQIAADEKRMITAAMRSAVAEMHRIIQEGP